MTTVLIVLAIIAVIALAWFFMRSRPQLPSVEDAEALPEPTSKPTTDAAATGKGEAKAEAPKAEAPKAEAPKAEAPKAEAPKAEAPKAEAPKAEAPKAEAPKAEAPEAEAPKAEAPKAEAPEAPVETAAAPVAEAPKAEAPKAEAPKAEAPKAPKDLSALRKGLTQTRTGWMQRLLSVFGGRKEIDPSLLEQIEETMLTGDIGAGATEKLVSSLKARLDRKELADSDKVWDALKDDARAMLAVNAAPFGGSAAAKPLVILMVGVNGAGKTTTIAKLADRYKEEGKRVLLAAGDTFRAAAVQQLEMWGRRVGVPVYKGKEGARPSAVIFEAVQQGAKDGVDVVIADTAGRLQTKAPLMEELRKIYDACGKALPGAPHETLLVLDATTGQNAISQAREFREALTLSGVVLTKLDGTAKGGVILAVAEEFKLPVRFIGVGEKSHDLREFDADDFVDALFTRGEDAAA